MKKDITDLFCFVDDFCEQYKKYSQSQTLLSNKRLTRIPKIETSKIMTIILLFQQSPSKNFKFFFMSYLQQYRSEFPNLPSYTRFVELQQRSLGHFYAFLMILCAITKRTGIAYADSTCIPAYPFVITKELQGIRFSKTFQLLGKALWDGFLDLNCIL